MKAREFVAIGLAALMAALQAGTLFVVQDISRRLEFLEHRAMAQQPPQRAAAGDAGR